MTAKRRAVCPGSFDPITNGHLDIIKRASAHFDEVVVAVFINSTKQSLFSVEERIDMIKETTKNLPNIKVDSWSGLTVDYCKKNGIDVITKGLRAVSDFDYELQMAQMNLQLAGVETIFMSTSPSHSFLSSSLIKEVCTYGGDVSPYVPKNVLELLQDRVKKS